MGRRCIRILLLPALFAAVLAAGCASRRPAPAHFAMSDCAPNRCEQTAVVRANHVHSWLYDLGIGSSIEASYFTRGAHRHLKHVACLVSTNCPVSWRRAGANRRVGR